MWVLKEHKNIWQYHAQPILTNLKTDYFVHKYDNDLILSHKHGKEKASMQRRNPSLVL